MSRARGPCRRCGGDEWYRNDRGHRFCAPCQRRRVAKRRAERAPDPIYRLWRNAKERARQQKVPFALTLDDVRAVWRESCPIYNRRWNGGPWRPSLDRLNPQRGYVADNIAVISMKANLIKSNATGREVEMVARWMRYRGL